MAKGLIFDFNGTMILDSKIQVEAWIKFLEELLKREVSVEEYEEYVYGKINAEVMHHFLDPDMSYEEAQKYGDRKEEIYIRMVKDRKIPLADGLEEFLRKCCEYHIPLAMATSAPYIVVRSLYDHYHLERFLPFDHIVYDHPEFRGKPAPDLYLETLRILGLSASECVSFEDSRSGIMAARNAGISTIFVLDPYHDYKGGFPLKDWDYRVIHDFTSLQIQKEDADSQNVQIWNVK